MSSGTVIFGRSFYGWEVKTCGFHSVDTVALPWMGVFDCE